MADKTGRYAGPVSDFKPREVPAKEISDSQYLIEYRNPDGSLLLPQYGGEWKAYMEITANREFIEHPEANLATPHGFFDLWEAMQKREDWEGFVNFMGPYELGAVWDILCEINPSTFPALVRSYLESIEEDR